MNPVDEVHKLWALGFVTADEAALVAVGGSTSDDARHYAQDLAEAVSGPHGTADLPALDRHRLAIERLLVSRGLDPKAAFPVDLLAEWLADRRHLPGHDLLREAGIKLPRPARPEPDPPARERHPRVPILPPRARERAPPYLVLRRVEHPTTPARSPVRRAAQHSVPIDERIPI